MTARLRSLVVLLLAGATPVLGAAGPERPSPPILEMDPAGSLVARRLPDVLSRPEVRPHLDSGLTTGFQITVAIEDAAGRRVEGGARVEVRYELWDEVYLIAVVPGAGAGRSLRAATFDELRAAWNGLALGLASTAGLAPGEWRWLAHLTVLPFSVAEQRDAQRWFSDTLRAGEAVRAEGDGGAARQVIDILIATSIQRPPLVRYAWRGTYRAGAPP